MKNRKSNSNLRNKKGRKEIPTSLILIWEYPFAYGSKNGLGDFQTGHGFFSESAMGFNFLILKLMSCHLKFAMSLFC